MNLEKLFDTQKVLMERIEKEHPTLPEENRRNKKILALYVEVGECANEWRGFKFWSKNQNPRTTKLCEFCSGCGKGYFSGNVYTGKRETCTRCLGTGLDKNKNPLLEEYVDGFHFVLELGIDTNIDLTKFYDWEFPEGRDDSEEAFLQVFEDIQCFKELHLYCSLLESYIRLGAALGFSWKEIEQGYYAKNKVNHERQENGY